MEGKAWSKFWKVFACACMVALCLALAACGGSSTNSSASGANSGANSAADPAEKFVGDWKLAAAEMEGFTVTGDFSSGILGEGVSMSMSLADDNTGSMSFNDDSADITWELNDDDTITITPVNEDGDITTTTADYDDGVLTLNLEDDEFSGKVYLSADGTMEGVRDISAANATAITSESELVGTWKLSGLNLMGMSMYGDADDLAEMMGDDSSYTTMEINSDGTATLMGEDATWEVGSSGAIVTMDDTEIPLKSLDGDIVLDIGELADGMGIDMIMLFTK